MRLPQPGQVISYSYLWWNEARQGREEGQKNRPCGVVMNRIGENDESVIYVLPITHTEPFDDEDGIEIPPTTRARLGLDDEPCWIITTELNRFTWPGPDIRFLDNGNYLYGLLPERLFKIIRQNIVERVREKKIKPVQRTES